MVEAPWEEGEELGAPRAWPGRGGWQPLMLPDLPSALRAVASVARGHIKRTVKAGLKILGASPASSEGRCDIISPLQRRTLFLEVCADWSLSFTFSQIHQPPTLFL